MDGGTRKRLNTRVKSQRGLKMVRNGCFFFDKDTFWEPKTREDARSIQKWPKTVGDRCYWMEMCSVAWKRAILIENGFWYSKMLENAWCLM